MKLAILLTLLLSLNLAHAENSEHRRDQRIRWKGELRKRTPVLVDHDARIKSLAYDAETHELKVRVVTGNWCNVTATDVKFVRAEGEARTYVLQELSSTKMACRGEREIELSVPAPVTEGERAVIKLYCAKGTMASVVIPGNGRSGALGEAFDEIAEDGLEAAR